MSSEISFARYFADLPVSWTSGGGEAGGALSLPRGRSGGNCAAIALLLPPASDAPHTGRRSVA